MLLIVVDTLRADRLGAYGSTRGLTPFVDSLAERATTFSHAVAACSWTNPSVASILTSRYQSQHGIVTFGSILADAEVTLPEVLQARGYVTGGFTANGLLQERGGYAQGYDYYRAFWSDATLGVPKFRTEYVNKSIATWLDGLSSEQHTKPLFLYIQYIDPHLPYNPPPGILAKVSGGKPPDLRTVNALAGLGILTGDDLSQFEDVYDAEVMSLDGGVRALFTDLSERGFLDNALVIFTADHGEQMMEHGAVGHGNSLHGEEVHVPLIMLAPGQRSGAVVAEPVSLLDIAPTIVQAAGGSFPPTFQGHSLLGTATGQPATNASPVLTQLIVVDESNKPVPRQPGDAVLVGHTKLFARTDGTEEFYDLTADPTERHPDALADAQRAVLRKALQTVRVKAETRSPFEAPPIDPATAERMRALGYLK
ncbi:MAG: sulfatase [bacterium]